MPDTQAPSDTAQRLADQQKLSLFEAVFEEIPDVIVLKDAHGNFLLCNQTLARLYNSTPRAMVGKHDGDFGVPQALADGYRANVQAIMARGETEVVFEDSRNALTGEIRHFKSIKRPFKDAQGNNQILVIAHDITDIVRAQQQVAQSEQRLQEVLAATQEGIWDWHVASGRVVHNPQWYRMLGFAEGEITGHVDAFSTCIHPEDKPGVWESLRRLLSGQDEFYRSEHRMLQKDGTIIWVLDRGRVAERNAQGEVVRVVGACMDISERKRHEVELTEALALAQSATRAKGEFVSAMGHELHTPLNDILDLSKVKMGKLELHYGPFGPMQSMDETAALFQQLTQSKGLQGRLLVAGDHINDGTVIESMLTRLGLQAEFVDNGHAAFEAVRRGPPFDLILMDVPMPVMDGPQAAGCIRQWEIESGAARTPIVAMMAGAFAEDRQRCAEAGMDDVLTKPIDRAALGQALARWLAGVT